LLGNLRRYTAGTSMRFATRHRGEGLKRRLVALRGDMPERLRNVVAWQPSPPHSGYFQALRNAPMRRGLKALAVHRKGIAAVYVSRAASHEATPFSALTSLRERVRVRGGCSRKPFNFAAWKATSAATWPPGDVPRSGTSQSALQTPGAGGEGWTRRPRRGNGHGCPFLFARAGGPVEKPGRPSRTGWATPNQRQAGVPFLLVTFLWASKEK